MRLIPLFLLIIAATSCGACREGCAPVREPQVEEDYFGKDIRRELERIITIYALGLKQKRCMQLEHAYIVHDFGYHVSLDFTSQDTLEIEEARVLFVEVVEEFLDLLNKDSVLASYTSGYEFTPEDLYYSIEYESFRGKYIDPLYVARQQLEEGLFTSYYAHDALDTKSVVYHKHYEPWETSVLIVHTQKEMLAEEKKQAALLKQEEIDKEAALRLKRLEFERELRMRLNTSTVNGHRAPPPYPVPGQPLPPSPAPGRIVPSLISPVPAPAVAPTVAPVSPYTAPVSPYAAPVSPYAAPYTAPVSPYAAPAINPAVTPVPTPVPQ